MDLDRNAANVGTYEGTPRTVEAARPIPTMLDRLARETEAIDISLNALIDRLVPVLSPERSEKPSGPSDPEAMPDHSPLGCRMDTLIDRHVRIVRVLEDLTARVEV